MHILIITPSVSRTGGVELFVQNLGRGLRANGNVVDLLSSETLPIIPIQGMKNLSFAVSGIISGLSSSNIRYDIIHAQNLPSLFPAKVLKARARVITLHGIYSEQIGILHGRHLEGMISSVERRQLESVDSIVAISRNVQKHYQRLGFCVDYIPNGIDLNSLVVSGRRLFETQITYVGRLSFEKGVDILIEAFKGLRGSDLGLVIVGSGPEEGRLRALAAKDSRILFLGEKSHKVAMMLIRGSDIFVLPSRMEGLGFVLLEAMAQGVPVIASNTGGIPELIENERTGLLFVSGDSDDLKRALVRLINDQRLASTLSMDAIAKVKRDYSLDSMTQKYIDLYTRVLG